MISRWCALSLTVALAALPARSAQTSAPHASAKPDYSQEPSVMEEMSTKVAFDNDGNATREQTSRILVQTDGGVQQWGLLTFPFQSATQTVEIDYVRVRKADGTTLVTPPDNVQDLDAEITRSAPFYSDLREKHVAVKGLGKGDVLEFEVHWHATKPLVPGQFWFQYNFQREGIVLDERIEISVPAGRAVKVKGPQATQAVTTEKGSRIYSWTYSKLQNTKEPESDEKKQTDAALGRLPAPDVQISSFQSWEEVGRWYWALQKNRVEPTDAIRAKAAELTKGMTDDAAKLHALYNFVSLQYRYIGIAFGIGRYQPHAAEDVLTNNYGDCKDKHTLLASLLQASGITLYPALINSTWKLDPDVPSPAQFDHVIGYLPGKTKDDKNKDDKNNDAVWLDTTPEVSPFGYLLTPLRDKQALVMEGEESAQLITTPADLPFQGSLAFKIDAKLHDDGTLEAKIEYTVRGEREILLRSAFRRIAEPQWKDLVQQISYGLGFAGTVSDVIASRPEVMTEPFHFSYSYNRKDYPDWTNHQFTVPGLPFFMPVLRDDAKDPIWLGSPQESVSDSKVELPKGYKPQLPSNVDLKYDFAEYHASYSQDRGVFIVKRRAVIKLREVPVSELDDYRSFVKNLQNDLNQYVRTSAGMETIPSSLEEGGGFSAAIQALPDSSVPEANQLEQAAASAMKIFDVTGAEYGLKKAVSKDPKFTRAWLRLGVLYAGLAATDDAISTLHKAIDSEPSQPLCHRILAYALLNAKRPDEAIKAWQDLLKVVPDDRNTTASLGILLLGQKRYSEALPYLEAAAKNDTSAQMQFNLGSAYLRTGQVEKGSATLEKMLDSKLEGVAPNAKAKTLNSVAWELVDTNASLPKALEYAQKSVEKQEEESSDVELSNLLPEDLTCTQEIGFEWDTLGWVHFRLGHLDQAESYLYAAWLLSQGNVEADHLGQVYEREKKTEKAIHMYRLALATLGARAFGDAGEETRHRLEHLTGKKMSPAVDFAHPDLSGFELSQLRRVKLKRLVPGSAAAEFFLLFSPGPKIDEVHFISGSEKLKSADQALSDANFQVAFPPGSSARLVRRAVLMCSSVTGCEAVLLTPDNVHSVK
jgi:tetratricopeptide (TPR) repeat protein/transglutaminase-like putative cysteine protease